MLGVSINLIVEDALDLKTESAKFREIRLIDGCTIDYRKELEWHSRSLQDTFFLFMSHRFILKTMKLLAVLFDPKTERAEIG